ncbi:hypothetical protein ARMSODRAFT_960436 [Armillaria solidipes]|uniref:Uncharacterized protein n=1 Tax=Armillaria solidipes TaxID=1076256 RepID=A0A2H3BK72_9AGAR|nr:hypothetical protein ARMSODRAFT_960436 [Armillaria solidipes]
MRSPIGEEVRFRGCGFRPGVAGPVVDYIVFASANLIAFKRFERKRPRKQIAQRGIHRSAFQIQVPGESWELLPTPINSDSCARMQIQGHDENTRRFIRCFGAKSTRSPISPKRMGLYGRT